jgi:fructose transport system permease protein
MSEPGDQRHEEVRAEQTALAVQGEISEHDRQQPTAMQRVQRVLHKYPWLAPLAFLGVMLVIFSFGNERFLTPFNASLIVQQVMFVGTLAIGQTIIILTAGVDLSVGAIAVFVSVVMGKLSADFGVPGVPALLVGFLFGTAAGLINGLLVTRLRLPPFIVTLGTLSIFFALNLYVSASTTIDGRDMDPIMTWTGTRIDVPVIETAVPISSFLMLGMFAIMWYILKYTSWGRHIYATGDDPEASRLIGIKVDRVLLAVYGVAGFIYAILSLIHI